MTAPTLRTSAQRILAAIEAFRDQAGGMPAETGEFAELSAAGDELAVVLSLSDAKPIAWYHPNSFAVLWQSEYPSGLSTVQPAWLPLYSEQPEPAAPEEPSPEDEWRRLALQFDGHRMQALWHLKAMLADPLAHAEAVKAFLSAGPLSGEQVLADRIAALVPVEPQQTDNGITHSLGGFIGGFTSQHGRPPTQREAFEKWARTLDMDLFREPTCYSDCNTEYAWGAWQARAALALPDAEPVAEAKRANLIECLREHARLKCIEGNEKRMVLQAAEMLAAAPVERKPLTKHEVHLALDAAGIKADGTKFEHELQISRAIEATHNIPATSHPKMNTYCTATADPKCDGCQNKKNWDTLNQMPDSLRLRVQAAMKSVRDPGFCIDADYPYFQAEASAHTPK